jgi:transposase
VKPLLPGRTLQRTGRPRVSDRAAFTAIVFVLVTGGPWRMVPLQIGCSGVTAWRRLRELHDHRRLRIRWERDPAVHIAFSPSPARVSAGATL